MNALDKKLYSNPYDGKEPLISNPWTGKNNKQYRSISFWVGTGYSASFLQVQNDLLNWETLY